MTDREKFEVWFDKKKQEMMGRGVPMVKIISICKLQWSAWRAALASQQPADDGWIEWAGGSSVGWKCPIDPEIIVDLKLRDGTRSTLGRPAGTYFWGCSDITPGCDIIAYRVVKP